MMPLPPGEPVR